MITWLPRPSRKAGRPTRSSTRIAEGDGDLPRHHRLARGQYVAMDVDRHQLLTEFRKLSEQTPGNGCRTMDILHVACALQLQPAHFVSFDARQRTLAAAAGLSVMPTD